MSNSSLEQYIEAIASKHGVILDKEDPILILITIIDMLVKQTNKNQRELLINFTSEIQESLNKLSDEINVIVEQNVVNKASESLKNYTEKGIQTSLDKLDEKSSALIDKVEKSASLSVNEVRKEAKSEASSWLWLLWLTIGLNIFSIVFNLFI